MTTSASSRQFGDLSTALILESKRSTQTDTLLKYNDSLVRQLVREQRELEKNVLEVEAKFRREMEATGEEVRADG